jgi:hypothetical protein
MRRRFSSWHTQPDLFPFLDLLFSSVGILIVIFFILVLFMRVRSVQEGHPRWVNQQEVSIRLSNEAITEEDVIDLSGRPDWLKPIIIECHHERYVIITDKQLPTLAGVAPTETALLPVFEKLLRINREMGQQKEKKEYYIIWAIFRDGYAELTAAISLLDSFNEAQQKDAGKQRPLPLRYVRLPVTSGKRPYFIQRIYDYVAK